MHVLKNNQSIIYTYSTQKSISKLHYDSSLRLDWNNLANYMPDSKGEMSMGKKLQVHATLNFKNLYYKMCATLINNVV